MATVHVGANADPHRASFWLAPPEGWLVPAESRRASTTPHVLTHRAGRLRVAVTPIRDRTTGVVVAVARQNVQTSPDRVGSSGGRVGGAALWVAAVSCHSGSQPSWSPETVVRPPNDRG